MASLPAPKNVSPLIRFGRWSALIAGVVYGSVRLRSLTRKEEVIQEHENKIRAKRDARLKIEKEQSLIREMNELGREAGVVKS